MKKKLEMEVGKKYRGYAVLNEYGEFDFMPEQTGARAGNIKQVKETQDYVLSTSKKKVLIHIRLERLSGLKLVQKLLTVMNEILTDLRTYEI